MLWEPHKDMRGKRKEKIQCTGRWEKQLFDKQVYYAWHRQWDKQNFEQACPVGCPQLITPTWPIHFVVILYPFQNEISRKIAKEWKIE